MHEKKRKIDWFSLKEAAEYLSIGEPTLYRWMKDKRITFRKVGDSTRFLKEDLDSIIEIHPSTKDSEKVFRCCPICHHDELIDGTVQSTGRSYFKPNKTKFWVMKESIIGINALMCTKCGTLTLLADTKDLKELIKEKKQ